MISLAIFALTRSAFTYMNTTPSEMLNYSFQMPDFSTWNLSTTYGSSIPDFSTWNLSTTYLLSVPDFSTWNLSTTYPTTSTTSTSDAWSVYYYLSGAIFFLASALIIAPRSNQYKAIDGISSMSDFTKTKLRRQTTDYKPNREVMGLVENNGMKFEEFLNHLLGNTKRSRRSS